MTKVIYPLKIIFHEDGEIWTLDTPSEVACNLEWYDSLDPKEYSTILDAENQYINVKVEKLELVRLEVIEESLLPQENRLKTKAEEG